jgi:hypothetical protein
MSECFHKYSSYMINYVGVCFVYPQTISLQNGDSIARLLHFLSSYIIYNLIHFILKVNESQFLMGLPLSIKNISLSFMRFSSLEGKWTQRALWTLTNLHLPPVLPLAIQTEAHSQKLVQKRSDTEDCGSSFHLSFYHSSALDFSLLRY